MKSKSAISFKELEHMANEAVEFGNDWGFYVDIETNNKLIYFNYVKLPKFNKKQPTFNAIKENETIEEKQLNKTSDYKEDENKEDKNKAEVSKKIIIMKDYNYFCKFMKIYFIKYSFPIITAFVLSYYIFKN
jgi:hypothetical protein